MCLKTRSQIASLNHHRSYSMKNPIVSIPYKREVNTFDFTSPNEHLCPCLLLHVMYQITNKSPSCWTNLPCWQSWSPGDRKLRKHKIGILANGRINHPQTPLTFRKHTVLMPSQVLWRNKHALFLRVIISCDTDFLLQSKTDSCGCCCYRTCYSLVGFHSKEIQLHENGRECP